MQAFRQTPGCARACTKPPSIMIHETKKRSSAVYTLAPLPVSIVHACKRNGRRPAAQESQHCRWRATDVALGIRLCAEAGWSPPRRRIAPDRRRRRTDVARSLLECTSSSPSEQPTAPLEARSTRKEAPTGRERQISQSPHSSNQQTLAGQNRGAEPPRTAKSTHVGEEVSSCARRQYAHATCRNATGAGT